MKNFFKSVVSIALCVIFIFCLSSCENEDKKETDKSTDKVLGEFTYPNIDFPPFETFEIETEKQVTIVYVSKSGKKIHRIPNCSGMKNYWTMSYDEAVDRGYSHCQNCY